MTAPTFVFDTVDAFLSESRVKSIVNLTASRVPEEWVAFVDRIRTRLSSAGYHLGPYRLQTRLARIAVLPMSLTLTKADYRFFQEYDWFVKEWSLPVDPLSGLVP
jgi:chromosomal replication initiation ATPase DnaA